MRLLLDTHIYLWYLAASRKLPEPDQNRRDRIHQRGVDMGGQCQNQTRQIASE